MSVSAYPPWACQERAKSVRFPHSMCKARTGEPGEMDCQARMSNTVQGAFQRVFSRWGGFVARRPLMVIVLSFAFAILCMGRLWACAGGLQKWADEKEWRQVRACA